MFNAPSLMARIAIGKLVGFIFGASAFIFVPLFMPEASQRLIWAFFFWYITFGAIIGAFGVMGKIPVINITLPWWFRGAYIGAWLNLVLTLFIYDQLLLLMQGMFGADSLLSSPFWLVLEGLIVGFVVDYFATKYGGEGPQIMNNDS